MRAALRPLVSRPSVVSASLSFATVIFPISSAVQVFLASSAASAGAAAGSGSAAAVLEAAAERRRLEEEEEEAVFLPRFFLELEVVGVLLAMVKEEDKDEKAAKSA